MQSQIAEHIKAFRSQRGLTQLALAKAVGVSNNTICNLENMDAFHGEIITPAVYAALTGVGLDLKEKISSLIIKKRRGKDRAFNPDLDVKLFNKDPTEMYKQAGVYIKEANTIINDKLSGIKIEIDDKQSSIVELEKLKKNILEMRKTAMDELVAAMTIE